LEVNKITINVGVLREKKQNTAYHKWQENILDISRKYRVTKEDSQRKATHLERKKPSLALTYDRNWLPAHSTTGSVVLT